MAVTLILSLQAGCGPDEAPEVPVIDHWLNQPCSPEGAKAKTRSGGDLVCKKVGSDPSPEWHAVGRPS